MTRRNHIDRLDRWGVVLFGIAALVCGYLAPYRHNPDANLYYGVALRLSEGEFVRSIDGLYSPLVSWLAAPLITLGLEIPAAFRTVNLAGYIFFLEGARRLFVHLPVSGLWRLTLIAFLGANLLPESLFVITADVLAAAAFVWALVFIAAPARPRLAPAAAALLYYAKSIQIIVFTAGVALASIFAPREAASKRALLFSVLAAWILALPWIAIISLEYGKPVVSGQQLLTARAGITLREYHPDLPFHSILGSEQPGSVGVSPEGSAFLLHTAAQFAASIGDQLRRGIRALVASLRADYFPAYFLELYALFALFGAGFVFLLDRKSGSRFRMFSWFAAVHIATYLGLWGANFRYYFPVLPVIHGWFLLGYLQLQSATGRMQTRARPISTFIVRVLFFSTLAVSITASIHTVYALWITARPEIVRHIVAQPALRERSGPLSSKLIDIHSGQVAYLLRREQWNVIDTRRSWTSSQLAETLCLWGVEQVLWLDEPLEALETLAGDSRRDLGTVSGTRISLYDVPCGVPMR